HVPGAINLPFAGNLDEYGRFLAGDVLADRFEGLADDPDAVVYCGSGVTACHNALAIERAGLPRPRVYVGSWSGWTADPSNPIATGPAPH
ncbi:MAG: sulfurtransferase, partial [Ilumatobacteraceae bacterium]